MGFREVQLPPQEEKEFYFLLKEICKNSRMMESCKYIQHGNTSVFRHSVSVAYVSCHIADKTKARINRRALIRGALLHDYFLYDWHEPDASHKWHGFHHAQFALKNALEDFTLDEVEQNMIRTHMFPLNLPPPHYKESWILWCADKLCSGAETIHGIRLRIRRNGE